MQGDRHGGSAVDYTVNARVGLPFITGLGADDEAVNHVLPAWDLVTGQMVATGLLAAERHRRRTGDGQHVTLALEDMALAVMGHLGFIAEAELGERRERHGNFLFGAFGKDFVTADGERVMVVGLTLKQWRALCKATGDRGRDRGAGGASRPRSRCGRRPLSRPRVDRRAGRRVDRRAAVRRRAARRSMRTACAGAATRRVEQLVRDDPACSEANPLFGADRAARRRPRPRAGPARCASRRSPRSAPRPAPRLGEHTEEVLLDVLRLDHAGYGRLVDRGIAAA